MRAMGTKNEERRTKTKGGTEVRTSMRQGALVVLTVCACAVAIPTAARQDAVKPGGYVIQRDAEVAEQQPGPHQGGGQTIGHSFFGKVPNLELVFRKRVLKPGAAIGYHKQAEDEIYYVLSGRGRMTLDGQDYDVGPGTAILTRTGSSHGLKQVGTEDLVIIINYLQ
jgi:mannose-6-phosphate isomerase-like protein (cupin superfamily)